MTGDKSILVDYKPLSEGLVTFGYDVTIRVLGKGTLNIEGFPWFKKVLHVEELKANLISVFKFVILILMLILTMRNVLFLILIGSVFVFVFWIIVIHLLHHHTCVRR